MNIKSLIWRTEVIDKIESKHGVTVEEVYELFKPGTICRHGQRVKKQKGGDF